ncbi:hypothetical protein GCM10009069_10290 [Algimonas arctica]|uniref:Uncharacterized protein n=1 Tax=Algimonas arctica TaxID=1479486 RepID=A0A8J3CRM8_9PROT|nr:hypothetical protein GCM10009069_10290 [Algimonas arctica]
MIIQLPGSQLINLLAQLTDEQRHQFASKATLAPPHPLCPCECGPDFAKITDLAERFVPPRLDL